mmetsp:Transcript_11992/g.23575  ORF Transcript_11992/g.23575 Transcript_11992/m.23575 type:complete len:299 (-) Transcript_11992:74-970(-)
MDQVCVHERQHHRGQLSLDQIAVFFVVPAIVDHLEEILVTDRRVDKLAGIRQVEILLSSFFRDSGRGGLLYDVKDSGSDLLVTLQLVLEVFEGDPVWVLKTHPMRIPPRMYLRLFPLIGAYDCHVETPSNQSLNLLANNENSVAQSCSERGLGEHRQGLSRPHDLHVSDDARQRYLAEALRPPQLAPFLYLVIEVFCVLANLHNRFVELVLVISRGHIRDSLETESFLLCLLGNLLFRLRPAVQERVYAQRPGHSNLPPTHRRHPRADDARHASLRNQPLHLRSCRPCHSRRSRQRRF